MTNDDESAAGPAPACLACDADSYQTPLIRLEYRGAPRWICPRHMPVLIHQPERLVDRLPGAGNLSPGQPPDR